MIETNDKLFADKIAWITLSKLKEFNDKPQLIFNLSEKFTQAKGNVIYAKFEDMYNDAVSYYQKHSEFPGLDYLNEKFDKGKIIESYEHVPYSMDMYKELVKQLDFEIILYNIKKNIYTKSSPDIEGCRECAKLLSDFADANVEVPLDVKDDWIQFYQKFKENYHGISTGNKVIDEIVGDLTGVVTIAAPSSHGKSTLALSLAFNISTLPDENGKGRNVLYLSYELTKTQLRANITAIESSFSDDINERLNSSDIREKKLDEREEALVEKHMSNYLKRLNISGGYLSLLDNITLSKCHTIEEFMSLIEEHSTQLGRKFDIIFVDNVDSLKVLKGDRGQDEMAKMNSFITKLDDFSKTYMDGYGTCIVLLSQTNREGIKKLKAMEANGSQEIVIDFTVLQQYSALYERATTVIVLYSSALMRASNQMKFMPVKLRNRPLPRQPITLTTRWEYSYVGGNYTPPNIQAQDLINLSQTIKEQAIEDNEDDEISESQVTGDVSDIILD